LVSMGPDCAAPHVAFDLPHAGPRPVARAGPRRDTESSYAYSL
jgi:hypothetical protein